ncbi:hypothetical protein COL922a_003163 [Colletotrichum nupharicola]|nr:hypothetical protein COL922a_003163 [Colletotrichum nupharicola]
MQFTATLTLLITAITAITGASASIIGEPYGYPPLPKVLPNNSVHPRKDQYDGVVCNIDHLSKTNKIFMTARHTPDGAYRYLIGLNGKAVQSAGPGRCTRVSCAHNLGVYFCNDNRHTIKYANDIGMICGRAVHTPNKKGQKDPYGRDHFGKIGLDENYYQNGQKHSIDRWSVFVNGDRC